MIPTVEEVISNHISELEGLIVPMEKQLKYFKTLYDEWLRLLESHKNPGIKIAIKEIPKVRKEEVIKTDTSIKLTPEVIAERSKSMGINFLLPGHEKLISMNDSQITKHISDLGNTQGPISSTPKFIKFKTKWEQLLVFFNTQIIDNPILAAKISLELPEISNTVRDAYLSILVNKEYIERVGKGYIKLLKPIPLDESSTFQRINLEG